VLLILDKGLGLGEAGLALAVYSATTIILELPTGGLADNVGRKKVYTLSLVVSFFGLLVLLLSQDLVTVAAAMLLSGAGRALSSGSIDAWFVDEFNRLNPGGDLQRALAKATAFVPLGLGAGALVGGALPMLFSTYTSALGASRFSVDIVAMLAIIVAQGLITQKIIHESESKRTGVGIVAGFRGVPVQLRKAGRCASRDRTVAVLLLISISMGFGLISLELLWQPRLSQLLGGESETWIFGALAAGYFLASSVGYVAAIPFCRAMRNDHPRTLFVVYMAAGILIAVLAMQTAVAPFALVYLLIYMMIGLLNSPFDALYNARVPSEDRSTMLSLMSLTMQAGGLVGNLVVGFIAGATSISVAWLVASGVVLFSTSGFLYLIIADRKAKGATANPS